MGKDRQSPVADRIRCMPELEQGAGIAVVDFYGLASCDDDDSVGAGRCHFDGVACVCILAGMSRQAAHHPQSILGDIS